MKKIVIMDAFSTMHVGNGALLENSIKVCEKAYPNSEITILTLDKKTNEKKYKNIEMTLFGTFAVKQPKYKQIIWGIQQVLFMFFQTLNILTIKINPAKIGFNQDHKNAMRAIQESDICISITGEALNDNVYKALYFWLFSYWMVIGYGKKFILFPQSIGPLEKTINKKLVFFALKNASLLVGRDKKSYEKLIDLGFDEKKVLYSPDVAILQDINTSFAIDQYFTDENIKKVIGITVSKIPNEIETNIDFIEKIVSSVKQVLDPNEYRILLMPSNYYPASESPDYQLCKRVQIELNDKYETAILSLDPLFPDDYKSLLCQLEVFITTRMHVAILATSGYIPTIAINTQHKIRGYMKNIDMEQYCLDFDDLDDLSDVLKKSLVENKKIREDLQNNLESMHKDLENFIKKFGSI
ncbi:MAG TPA: polysaccharide pyruvyl transferase family protein [Lutibacter sp.]|nr:polysaccharide pyruvyl transferase family protein [Lutibacter sp.]